MTIAVYHLSWDYMSDVMKILIYFLLLFVRSTQGLCGNNGYLVLSKEGGFQVQAETIGYCCFYCLEARVNNPNVTAWQYYAPYKQCTCVIGIHSGRGHGAYRYYNLTNMFIKPPTQFKSNIYSAGVPMSVGTTRRIDVTIWAYIQSDSSLVVYAIEDINTPHIKSEKFKFTFVNGRVPATSKYSLRSNIPYTMESRYEAHHRVAYDSYEYDFKVGSISAKSNETWLVSVFENENMTEIMLRPQLIERDAVQCHAVVSNVDKETVAPSSMKITFRVTASTDCNKDLENQLVVIATDESLRSSELLYNEKSLKVDKISYGSKKIVLKFYLAIGSFLEGTLIFSSKSNIQDVKRAAISITFYHHSFTNNTKDLHVNQSYVTFIINHGLNKGYFLRDVKTGRCLAYGKYGSNEERFYRDFAVKCSVFEEYGKDVRYENGQCLHFQPYKSVLLKTCLSGSTMKYKLSGSYFVHGIFSDQKWLNTINITSQFVKEYLVKSTYYKDRESVAMEEEREEILQITTLDNGNYVTCKKNTYTIKSSTECAKVMKNKSSYLVIRQPKVLQSLLGQWSKHNVTFYRDTYGNTYKQDNHQLAIISKSKFLSVHKVAMLNDSFVEESRISNPGNQHAGRYFRALENTGDYVNLIWKASQRCNITVGITPAFALRSCKAIKQYCSNVNSGYYWLNGGNESKSFYAYCDMETDEGGWLQILDIKLPTYPLYFDIGDNITDSVDTFFQNYTTTYLTAKGLDELHNLTNFTQLRLYCHSDDVGYDVTVHIVTFDNENGYDVINYIKNNEFTAYDNQPKSCSSFKPYHDDNSYLSRQCKAWAHETWGLDSHYNTMLQLYDFPMVIHNYAFAPGVRMGRRNCDSNLDVKNGSFAIYVR